MSDALAKCDAPRSLSSPVYGGSRADQRQQSCRRPEPREASGGGRAACIATAIAASLLAAGVAAAAQVAPPRLGRAATPDEVAKVDISIPPDGKGLPTGSGTVAQGAMVYAAKCVVCHGPKGAGTPSGDRLRGGGGSLGRGRYVTKGRSYWQYERAG